MFRDQRLRDNWALIHAVDEANRANVPVAVAFNLFDEFKGAKARQLGFMLRGLKQLESAILSLGIPFFLLRVIFPALYPLSFVSNFLNRFVLIAELSVFLLGILHLLLYSLT